MYIETEKAQPDIIGITFASGTSPITVGENLIQNVPFFKVIQANINDDSGSRNYNFYYYDADDSLRHYYLSLPENYSGIVLIRKEIQYGEIDQLLSVSTSSINISNLIINLTSESLEISNGRFVEADDITFVNGLMRKDENAFIGSADKPFSVIYGKNLKGTADSATQLANEKTIWGQPFNGTQNVSGDLENVGNITPMGDDKNLGSESNNFANVYATTFIGNLSGKASTAGTADTATALATSITLWGRPFNGTQNVSEALTGADGLTPTSSETYDIGSADKKYKDLYLSGSLHTGTLEATGNINASSLTLSGNGTINGTLKVLGTGESTFSGNINASGKTVTAQTFVGSLEGTASSVSNILSISIKNNQNSADNQTIVYDGSETLSLSLTFQPLTSEDIAELGIFTEN